MIKMNEKHLIEFILEAMSNVEKSCYDVVMATNELTREKELKRERVYCYELYHQMRLLQKKGKLGSEININAEIDKRGHSIIKDNFNPDFIIHQQGSMTNYCTIEVKREFSKDKIKKDFEKLTCMLNRYNYQIGIFILIHFDEFETENFDFIKSVHRYEDCKDRLYIITQKNHSDAPKQRKIEDFLKEMGHNARTGNT